MLALVILARDSEFDGANEQVFGKHLNIIITICLCL